MREGDKVNWELFHQENKVLMGRTYAQSRPEEGFADNYAQLHINAWEVEKPVRRWFEKRGFIGKFKNE